MLIAANQMMSSHARRLKVGRPSTIEAKHERSHATGRHRQCCQAQRATEDAPGVDRQVATKAGAAADDERDRQARCEGDGGAACRQLQAKEGDDADDEYDDAEGLQRGRPFVLAAQRDECRHHRRQSHQQADAGRREASERDVEAHLRDAEHQQAVD